MTAAASTKAALRAEMRQRRRAVSATARARVAASVCERLLALPLGGMVAVYLAGPDEIDLTAFVEAALARGTRLLAPRWTGETYALADLEGLGSAHLRVGPHGILEPRQPLADVEPAAAARLPTAWLVPGLAFARDGGRADARRRLLVSARGRVAVRAARHPPDGRRVRVGACDGGKGRRLWLRRRAIPGTRSRP